MEEEIKRIIKMLEEGKINASEAEKLIRAVKDVYSERVKSEKEFSHKRKVFGFGKFISDWFDFEFGSWSKEKEYKEMEFENIKMMKILHQGGDLKINTFPFQSVYAYFAGSYEKTGEKLYFKTVKDGKLEVPENISLEISLLGGNLDIEGKFENIKVQIMGGNLNGDIDFKNFSSKIMGGNVFLKIPKGGIKVKTKIFGGDFYLPDGFIKKDEYFYYDEGNEREIDIKIFGGSFELKFKED